jgi:hypothetical protein
MEGCNSARCPQRQHQAVASTALNSMHISTTNSVHISTTSSVHMCDVPALLSVPEQPPIPTVINTDKSLSHQIVKLFSSSSVFITAPHMHSVGFKIACDAPTHLPHYTDSEYTRIPASSQCTAWPTCTQMITHKHTTPRRHRPACDAQAVSSRAHTCVHSSSPAGSKKTKL